MKELIPLLRLVLEVSLALVEAFREHGAGVLELRLRDVLPERLLTTVARAAAEERAKAKFE